MHKKLKKLEVSEKGFTQMLELLGEDCSPVQFVREFTFNSFEAINRTEKKEGIVEVDVNWLHHDWFEGVYRLSFTDNGDGMTGEEMLEYIAQLSSSMNDGMFKNYGMGAKIASITRNPCGVLYQSWKNGVGSQLLIRYDQESQQYAVAPWDKEDGTIEWTQLLDDEVKPKIINQHGTRVTLLGKNDSVDTMKAPDGVKYADGRWLERVLNDRYFEIPPNIILKARHEYTIARDKDSKSFLSTVIGQKSIFENMKEYSGTVDLTNAVAHWWILKKDRQQGFGRQSTHGHTAVVFQNEIFERTANRNSRARDFGVIFGEKNVSIYIEPKRDNFRQTTSRSSLLQKDGNSLPWEVWQEEFRINMPDELTNYMDSIISQIDDSVNVDSIKERLKKYVKFFKVGKYRLSKKGDVLVDPDNLVSGMTGGGENVHLSGSKKPSSGPRAGLIEEALAVFKKSDGVNAVEINPDPFPQAKWVSMESGTREKGEMEDRAASYLPRENLIKMNGDFQGYKDIEDHFIKEYKNFKASESQVSPIIKQLFQQQLMESVATALSFRNRPQWSPDDFEAAVSEEALTLAVGSRYYLMTEAKRVLSGLLGKPEDFKAKV